MEIIQRFSVNNDCYRNNINKADSRYTTFQNRGPQGLMLHSVGCAQPNAKVFADGWNQSGKEVAVHAVLQADGIVYQCMPWNFRGWHAGGSANNTHIGVEMTEPSQIRYTNGASFVCDDLEAAKRQADGCYKTARDLFAMLCKEYDMDPEKAIISHAEGARLGVASNHADPEHLWKGLGLEYTMDAFRSDVKKRMEQDDPAPAEPDAPKAPDIIYRVQVGAYSNEDNAKAFLAEVQKAGFENAFITKVVLNAEPEKKEKAFEPYLIRVTVNALNVRSGAGMEYGGATVLSYGEIYTIVAESNGWGKLKSGAGWICLDYTEKV